MAFRSQSWLKSLVGRLRVGGGSNSTFATSTSPKLKAAYSPTALEKEAYHFYPDVKPPRPVKGEFVPVYVALGMIMMSAGLGLHTAIQHLFWAPGVYVKKSRRETLPEVVDPDQVADMADRFIKKSFFRKVAHVQDTIHREDVMSDPIRGDVLARKPRAATLKSVGVDPQAL